MNKTICFLIYILTIFVPMTIYANDATNLKQMTGLESIYVVTDNGELWVWGENDYGQLGTGTTEFVDEPVKVMENVNRVTYMYNRWAYILKNDSSLWAVGFNEQGQLLDGTMESKLKPVKIMENCKQIAGRYFLKNDGTVLSSEVENFNASDYYDKNMKDIRFDKIKIADNVQKLISKPYRDYAIMIKDDGTLAEDYFNDSSRFFGKIKYAVIDDTISQNMYQTAAYLKEDNSCVILVRDPVNYPFPYAGRKIVSVLQNVKDVKVGMSYNDENNKEEYSVGGAMILNTDGLLQAVTYDGKLNTVANNVKEIYFENYYITNDGELYLWKAMFLNETKFRDTLKIKKISDHVTMVDDKSFHFIKDDGSVNVTDLCFAPDDVRKVFQLPFK